MSPVREPAPIPPITGIHGRSIGLVAVTDAGDAAVTADDDGAIRLWPTVDGKREPVVVSGQRPRALEIERDGDGFVIANHDVARGVELVRLDGRGQVRSRARIANEPAVEQVELSTSGAFVLRADQTIEVFDASGARLARLVPDPGTRIAAIVGRAGRVLAIIGDEKQARAHWIEVSNGTAVWGAQSPQLPFDSTRLIALSPDHRLLLGSQPGNVGVPTVLDLTTGKDLVTVCTSDAELALLKKTFVDENFPGLNESWPAPFGFADASTIVCQSQGVVSWWKPDGTAIATVGDPVRNLAEPAVGGGRIFGSAGAQLAIYKPESQQYLGYAFRELSHMRVAPIGVLIGKGDQAPLLLDAGLHETARYPLPKGDLEWTDLLPIDERYVLRMSSRKMMLDQWGTAHQITVFDMNKGIVHQQLPNLAQEVTLAYEPATRLLATSDGTTRILLRYDLATHSFGERFELDGQPMHGVYLLDPGLSGGVVALTIDERGGALVVGELHGDDLLGTKVRARRTYSIPGQLRAVDRSGRVYAQGAAAPDVLVYTRGTQFARLGGLGGMTLHPSPDATHIAAFRDSKVRLVAVDGRVLWDVALWGSADVDWTATGELIARYKAGLAKLDRATGALRDRQCGWGFGIADKPFEHGPDLPMVCDVSP